MRTVMTSSSEQNMQMQKRSLETLGEQDLDEAKRAKLRSASEGFEAIFIQRMWEQMRENVPKDGLMTSKDEKFWQSMYDQELSKSMASAGGIGLADMMMEQLDNTTQARPTYINGMPMAQNVSFQQNGAQNTTENATENITASTQNAQRNVARSGGLAVAPAPLFTPKSEELSNSVQNAPQVNTITPMNTFNNGIVQAQSTPILNTSMYEEAPKMDISTLAARENMRNIVLEETAVSQVQNQGQSQVQNRAQNQAHNQNSQVNSQSSFQQNLQANSQDLYEDTDPQLLSMRENINYSRAGNIVTPQNSMVNNTNPVVNNVNVVPMQEMQFTEMSPVTSVAPISSVEEVQNMEPIVTRVTYTTNVASNKRKGEAVAKQLITQATQAHNSQIAAMNAVKAEGNELAAQNTTRSRQLTAQQMFNGSNLQQRTTGQASQAGQANSQLAYAEFIPTPVQQMQAQQQMQARNEPQDLLSGINTSYVKTNAGENNSLSGVHRDNVHRSQLQPSFGGGQDISRPRPVLLTQELGYNPDRGSLLEPVEGKISSGFGWRLDPFNGKRSWHNGVDINAKEHTPVRAADSGIVSFAGYDEDLGNTIVLEHASGLTTIYGHNGDLNVSEGDFVQRGTEIATVGSTGRTLGNHLHFEIRKKDMPINPEAVFGLPEQYLASN